MMVKDDKGKTQYVSRPDWTFKQEGHEKALRYGAHLIDDLALEIWKEGHQVGLWVVVVSESGDVFNINDISFYEVSKVRFISKHRYARKNVASSTIGGQMNRDQNSLDAIKLGAIINA